MRLLLSALAATALTGSALAGDSETAPPPPAGPPPAEAPAIENSREANLKRLIAEHPELKGVDPSTPEGRERIQQVMQAKMAQNAPQIRERMAKQQAAQHAELKKALALGDAEFAAFDPLLSRVDSLKLQKNLVDRSAGPGGPGFPGRRGGPGGPGPDLKLLLGETPIDPTIQELQDSLKALKTLVENPQANAADATATLERVRKARATFDTTLGKAEEALRAVLKPHQEAILVERGILR